MYINDCKIESYVEEEVGWGPLGKNCPCPVGPAGEVKSLRLGP